MNGGHPLVLRKSGKIDTFEFAWDADDKAIISRIAHMLSFAVIAKEKDTGMQRTMLQLGLVKENKNWWLGERIDLN